jgi:glycine amidinotransferase
MTENSRETVVNSWNEWDPLKHVIVGRADGTQIQAPEPAVQLDFPDQGYPLGTSGALPKEIDCDADR